MVQWRREQYEDDLFFCDYCSPLVHPVGWSALVGHNLNATSEYQNSSGKKIKLNQYEPNDSTPAMFPAVSASVTPRFLSNCCSRDFV